MKNEDGEELTAKDIDITLTIGNREIALQFVEEADGPCEKCCWFDRKANKCGFPNALIASVLCGPGKGYWKPGKVTIKKEGKGDD